MLIRLDLADLEKELGKETDRFLEDLSVEIVNELKANSPTGATGDLRASWQIFRQGDGVVWLGSRLPYALFVNEGTGPIDNPPPPFEPIKVWARRKLGDEDAAGAVWNKLRTEGMDANPYLQRSIDQAIQRVT